MRTTDTRRVDERQMTSFRRGIGAVIILGIVAVLTPLGVATDAAATTPAELCAGQCWPCTPQCPSCTVGETHDVDDGATLDFDQCDVILRGTLRAATSGGAFTVQAASLTIDGGALLAPGSDRDAGGEITVEVPAGTFRMQRPASVIDVDGDADGDGGIVTVTAGSIDVGAGVVRARGTGVDAAGGTVTLTAAGVIRIDTLISVEGTGSSGSAGGSIELIGGSLAIEQSIDASGRTGEGGAVTIESTDADITIRASLRAEGGADDASGGDVSLNSAAALTIDGGISASGGVDGVTGSIELSARGNVTIQAGRTLSVHQGSIQSSSPVDLLVAGTLDVSGRHNEDGGDIQLGPHCNVVIRGTLDARGGSGAAAGSNTIEAKAITIASTARVRAMPCTELPPGSSFCNTPILREGDPVIEPGAVIDPPFPPESIHDPTLPVCCGNGNTLGEPWEECDDGNEQWCDQCTPACRTPVPCAADDDPCTGDTCVPTIGCQPLTGPSCADDGNPCTDDVCEQGRCTHPSPCDGARDDACRGGTCDPVLGCVFHPLPDGMQCALVCTGSGSTSGTCRDGRCITRCDDGDECTTDGCWIPNLCGHSDDRCRVDCMDSPDGTPCSDGLACTIGHCMDHACVAEPVTCGATNVCEYPYPCSEDGSPSGAYGCFHIYCPGDDPCAPTQCDPELGCVSAPVSGAPCDDDGARCTRDVCEAGVCTHPPQTCDDGDACTEDSCDPSMGCVNIAIDCDPTPTPTLTPTETPTPTLTITPTETPTPAQAPTPTPACGPTPDVGCRMPIAPLKSQIVLKDKQPDAGDLLTWKWTKGAATLKADFGAPLTTTSYTLCLYDETSGTPVLVLAAHIPAGEMCAGRPCWKEKSRGFTYVDKDATPDGVTKLILREGLAGVAKIILKAKGANVDMPGEDPPGENDLPLRQDTKVTVQLKNNHGGGICWDAEYTSPAIVNDELQFKDRSN